jgi:glycosyltransferase involved in cell wall biosynthesis
MELDYTVVIPTVGRDSLGVVLTALEQGTGPRPREVILVDDRVSPTTPLRRPPLLPVRILQGGGGGPAAARNRGWRAACSEWVAFLDDDVVPAHDWAAALAQDLSGHVDASQARITVPLPADRPPTDYERGTAGLATAQWITADMAFRRAALARVGGFDERFPRAYREDAELALRLIDRGCKLVVGERVTTHPVRAADFLASVRAQRGNADDALMRRLHGPGWRARIGGHPGRLRWHALTTASAAATILFGLLGHRRAELVSGTAWALLTADFALRRVRPGPRTTDEVLRMALTSIAIPPAACAHRLLGELRFRGVRP